MTETVEEWFKKQEATKMLVANQSGCADESKQKGQRIIDENDYEVLGDL